MAADNPSDNARTRVVDNGAPLALAVGTLLGRYRVDGVLGQGGFGITYRATDTALNRAVAIKEYLPSDVAIRIDGSTVIPRSRTDAEDYDWGLKRFLDEAKTLAQHEAVPNVVRVYDFVEANGTAYMVMALVEGDNLSAILRQRGTLDEQELRAIVLPLLDGLEQLHEAGLIHRDIKPANIILRGGRSPTLIDFGAAREGLGRKSRSVTSILTPGYAPFEQYGSAGDQGPWTDIYALAATIYHGIAGKAPPDSVDRIRRDPMVPAVQAGAGKYSDAFLAAIDAGLKVDERERPQNAAQWRELFGGAAVPTIAPTTTQPVPVAPAAPPSASVPTSQPVSQPVSQPAPSLRPSIEQAPTPSILSAPPVARAGSRSKMMIAAGVAVVLIGGGVAAAVSMSGSSTPATPQAVKPDNASIQLAAAEKERIEADKRRTAELEKRLAEEETKRKAAEEQQAKMLADADRRRQAEDDARKKAEAEAENKRRLDEENRKRAEAEAENRKRIEEETRKKVETEFKAKAEEEAKKRQAEDEAKRKAEEAKKKVEDDAKKKAEDEAKKKAEDEAKKKAEQQKAVGTQVAAATPQAQQQAAPADPAAYVAQHWATSLRPKVEAALRQRGAFTDTVTGGPVKFDQIHSYRVVNVTPTQIILTVTYRNTPAAPGGHGSNTITSTDYVDTATFVNRAPDFPLVSVSAAARPSVQQQAAGVPASQQLAAAPAVDRAAIEAQHGAALRQRAEQAIRAKGPYTELQSGAIVSFVGLNRIDVVQASAAEVVVQASYQAQERSGFQRTHLQIVQLRFHNQPPSFPLIAAGQPSAPASAPSLQPPQSQVAAAAAAPDAAAYVAQHWSVMKPKIETALRQRGAITDTVSGGAMRFDQIYNYRVVYVTPAHVALAVTYRNVRAVPGGGNMTGTSADITETAIFQNQAPDFPLVSLK
jgi:TolA protein